MNVYNGDLCSISWSYRSVSRTSRTSANISDGKSYKNNEQLKPFNYWQKELHLRCCSSPRFASGVRALLLCTRLWKNDHLCDQLLLVQLQKTLKLPQWNEMIKSKTKPLPVKVYFTPLKQKTNLSSNTVKSELVLQNMLKNMRIQNMLKFYVISLTNGRPDLTIENHWIKKFYRVQFCWLNKGTFFIWKKIGWI